MMNCFFVLSKVFEFFLKKWLVLTYYEQSLLGFGVRVQHRHIRLVNYTELHDFLELLAVSVCVNPPVSMKGPSNSEFNWR